MATEKDFKIKNGLILNNDNSGARVSRSGNYLKNTTQYGYIQFGPNNTGFAHIDTDRTNFYFSKKLTVDEGIVQSYNENLVLRYYENSNHQLTISTSAATFAGNVVVTGNLTVNGSTITNSATNTTIEDALIELGSGNSGTNSNDLGLILERGSTGDNAFIGWQEANDRFIVATTTATGASTGALSVNRANLAAGLLQLSSNIEMPDSAIVKLGTGDDLQLYHNGTDSAIDNYTGDLYITNTANDKDIIFRSDDGSGGHHTYFLLDGSNNKTQFNRHLKIIDNMQIQIGTNPDLLLYHDGSHSYIKSQGSGTLVIEGGGDSGDLSLRALDDVDIKVQNGELGARFLGNGAAELYYNNSKKLNTTSTGVFTTGFVASDHDMNDSTPSSTNNNFFAKDTNALAAGNGGAIVFSGIYTTGGDHLGVGPYVKGYKVNATSGDYGFGLRFGVRENGQGSSAVALTIDSTGNAGFGTGSPEERIEVNGNIRMQSPISTTTARPAATVATLNSGEIRAKNSDGSDGGLLRLSAGAGTTQNTMSYIDLQGYSSAESQNGKHIIFGTGGTDRMEIDSLGRVYIGTTNNTTVGSPDDFLTVGSTTNNEEVAYNLNVMEGSNNRRAKFFLDDNSGLYGFDTTASSGVPHFVINTATTERFRITNAGNVGIGVTSPDSILDVNGDITMTANIVHKGDSNTYFGFHGNDLFRVVTGGTERFEVSNSGIIINDGSADYDFRVESNDSANMLFVDGGLNRVGIGTGSPAETFEVGGTMKVGNMKFQNAAGGRLGFNRNTGTGAIYDNSYGAYQFQNNQSGYFEIQVYDSSGNHVTAHTYTTTGRVGLGTTSPTNRLSVNGNMNVTGTSTMGDSSSDSLVFTGLLKQGLSGGTTVMDASRNMSNIGTISSGAITSTGTSTFGTLNATQFDGHIEAGGHLDFNIGVNHGTTGNPDRWWISQHSTGQSDVPGSYYDIINLSSSTTHGIQIASQYGSTAGVFHIRNRSDNSNSPAGTGLQAWKRLYHQDYHPEADTLTTARTIGGVSFDGSANINLPGVNTAGNQNTSGTAAGLSGTPNITVGTITSGKIEGTTADANGHILKTDSSTASASDIALQIRNSSADYNLKFQPRLPAGNMHTGVNADDFGIFTSNSKGIAIGNNDKSLVVIHPTDGIEFYTNNANRFNITTAGNFQLNGTTVIDASRNLTNIGTISSGAISSTGQVSGTKGAFTQSSGSLPLHTQTPYDFTAKFESTDAGGYIVLEDNTSTNNGNYIGVNGDEFRIYTGGSRALRIASNNTITTDSNLTVSGNVTHNGLTMTSGTDIDQLTTTTVTATLSTSWQDTGIDGSDLSTGTYIVQVFVDDHAVGGNHYDEYYSGIMSWFSTNTNSTVTDEILLHRAGHAPNNGDFFLRTERTANADSHDLMLQMRGSTSNSGNSDYIFKFRRMI